MAFTRASTPGERGDGQGRRRPDRREIRRAAPDIAIVLGTGLGPLAERAESAIALPYAQIRAFRRAASPAMPGVSCSAACGRRVLFHAGRVHYYEMGDAAAMRLPLEALALAGVELLLTNSCSSLRRDLAPASMRGGDLRPHQPLGLNP